MKMRRSGKTTRKVDEAIQILFKEGRICIPTSNTIRETLSDTLSEQDIIDEEWYIGGAQRHLLYTIINRLSSEHLGQFEVKGRCIMLKNKNCKCCYCHCKNTKCGWIVHIYE